MGTDWNLSELLIEASDTLPKTKVFFESDVKEFIKRDWVLTNHFLWDLLRDLSKNKGLNLSDFWIEKMIANLKEKKNKLSGEKLIIQEIQEI